MSARYLAALAVGCLFGCTPAQEPHLIPPALSGSAPIGGIPTEPAPMGCSTSQSASANQIARVEVRGLARLPMTDVCKGLRTLAGLEIDERRVRQDAEWIWDTGLFDDVNITSRPSPAGATVAFLLHERPLVRRWSVHGVQSGYQERVVSAFPQAGQIFDPESLREGEVRVREEYVEDGYRRIDLQYKVHPAPHNEVDVDVTIVEGPRALVQSIALHGFSRGQEAELRALIDTGGGSFNAPGKPYRPDVLERDRLLMAAYYYDRGMIHASVAEEVVTLSADGTSATLAIEISEGPVYRLSKKTRCVGDLAGSEKKCLELLGAKKGEVFSRAAIMQGMDRIREFQQAKSRGTEIEPQVTPDDKAQTIDLTISIAKAP